ncbi:polysaccharide biosynthesis protein [Gracilibacillus caseinilyticus]|uniref:Polysaccharide biosynthesis protein n=1 Tax=Gracilibacillus caseinilyticus TaxID=2932256 RepID=A0ABY4EZT0_9BACI|nr:polysaccharide biosynthesis protein [Gracilibacillus caseinilyticus]UOQ49516.1 polysaccharide biosynthesis protein [Gracilibacillus caseinilyticus]
MKNENRSNKQLYKGAFALVTAGLVSKVISAFYRVPLQNLTGDIGFYIYQQIYPILGIAFMLALYGFPSAISGYLAERGRYKDKHVYPAFFSAMFLFSVLLFLLLYLFSPLLAEWMGDKELAASIRHTAWVFLFVPFVALWRGIAQSEQMMESIAYSQMIEQLIRAFVIICTAILIYNRSMDVYDISFGAMIASVLALSASSLFMYAYRKQKKKKIKSNISFVPDVSLITLMGKIIGAGIVISLNHMLLLLLQLADAFTIVQGLMDYGQTLTASTATKGIFDRGQPLLQLVTVVGSSFAMALVPQVSRTSWQLHKDETIDKVRMTLKYCVLLSVGATIGLIVLFPEINQLLFQNQAGTASLRLLSLSLLFTCLIITVASTLQSFGYMKWTAIILFVGLWIKVLLNHLFIPQMGITGGAVATVVTVFLIFICNFSFLKYLLKGERLLVLPWLKLIAAGGLMAIIILAVKQLITLFTTLEGRFSLLCFVLFSVIAGLFVYLFLIVKWKVITNQELAVLPIPERWKKGMERKQ